MNFTVRTLAKSLAGYLSDKFPGVTFYEDPNQQETKTPCFFLQVRHSNIVPKTNERFLRTIGLDLVYLERYNLPNLQEIYQRATEVLDECMETFPYSDGTDEALLRTYERNANVDEDAAHYNFELRLWVTPERGGVPMMTMDYQEEILNG